MRNDVASPIEGLAVPSPEVHRREEVSPDAVRDAFEGDLSRFPLDVQATKDKVTLRLVGVCRWQGHYIVRVAIDNQTDADLFIKELSAYDGSTFVTIKSYFRLFVEAGRSREGHVLFDATPGSKIKLRLKEDREGGRTIEAPVRYPF